MLQILRVTLFILAVNADFLSQDRNKGASLKPISACCDIPELGDAKPLTECSDSKLSGPCTDIQCVFEKSGFLVDKQTLNKEVYRNHLRKWLEGHKEWTDAIEKAIKDCVDKDLRQYLDYPCKAYDVFTCTGIAMLKIVLSEQIPPHCRGPPPDVENPRDCCKSEKIFSEEDFKACGIEKPKENEKLRQIPDCSKQICLLNRYSLMQDDNTVDKEAVGAFLDKHVEKNADFKDAVESAKELCLKHDLPGPPAICEANKIVFCTSGTIFMNCPNWKDTDNCKKLKNHFEDCKKYFV